MGSPSICAPLISIQELEFFIVHKVSYMYMKSRWVLNPLLWPCSQLVMSYIYIKSIWVSNPQICLCSQLVQSIDQTQNHDMNANIDSISLTNVPQSSGTFQKLLHETRFACMQNSWNCINTWVSLDPNQGEQHQLRNQIFSFIYLLILAHLSVFCLLLLTHLSIFCLLLFTNLLVF